MKCSKAAIHRKTYRIPDIRFEDQKLTCFGGLVVYQALFSRIGLKQQLSSCFRRLKVSPIFGHGVVVLLLVVHLLLGYRPGCRTCAITRIIPWCIACWDSWWTAKGIEFTISVPFERFAALKILIENRKRWRRIDGRETSFFETDWKLAKWKNRYRFMFIRNQNRKQAGNQVYLLAAGLAHNANREIQMLCFEKQRNTTEKPGPLWRFEQLGTLRRKLIQRAGRLTRPQGKLTLTMSINPAVKSELLHYLNTLKQTA